MSGIRAPRVQVLADGGMLAGVLAADVFANNHLAADRFRLRIAASVADLAVLQAPGLRLDVQVGWDGGWTSLIVGVADSLAFDPVRGELDVEGRDRSCLSNCNDGWRRICQNRYRKIYRHKINFSIRTY